VVVVVGKGHCRSALSTHGISQQAEAAGPVRWPCASQAGRVVLGGGGRWWFGSETNSTYNSKATPATQAGAMGEHMRRDSVTGRSIRAPP
jgi:hypothetical protein